MKKVYIPLMLLCAFYGAFAQNYTLQGTATVYSGCNCFQLTPAQQDQGGAVYQTHTINLTNSFDYTFSNYFGCPAENGGHGGADGMVFALTANPGNLGGQGQALGWGNGYGSQPCSVGVEFDTWVNGGSDCSSGECDPNYNEVAIMANGSVCHCDAANSLSSVVPADINSNSIWDCNWHTIRIVWDVNSGTLSVYFDGNLRTSYTDPNMIANHFCGNPTVYWGWTASTGGGVNRQITCLKTFSTWVAAINYQNCTPTVQFTDVSTSNANLVSSWQWQFGDGTTSNLQNPSHTYPSGGATYTASLIITDVNGCADTFSHDVIIAPPMTLTTVNQHDPLCNGGSDGGITVSASGGFGNTLGHGGYQYLWTPTNYGDSFPGIPMGTYTVTVTDGQCTATGQYTLNQPTALTATTTSTAADCGTADGSVSITVTGGTLPYQYIDWVAPLHNGATYTGLSPGTYVADFKDANGCSALATYKAAVVGLPCGYTLSSSGTDVTCFGGSNGTATVSLTGASVVQPVTYLWTPGGQTTATATNLTAGTYTYTVNDASGAGPWTNTVVVGGPPTAFTINLNTVPTSCGVTASGVAITSVTSGGKAPFNYAWSPAHPDSAVLTGLSAGGISVTVTDATGVCTATASGTITGPPPLLVSVNPVNDSCFAGQGSMGMATANATGGTPPYFYIWSNNSTAKTDVNLTAGNYIVTVTDSTGCSATSNGSVTQLYTTKVSHTIAQQNILCFGNSTGSITVTPSGGNGPYTYIWNPATVSGNNPTGLAPGFYAVTIVDALDCQNKDTALLTQPAAAVTVSTGKHNITCNGGKDGWIAFSITGGVPPYFYNNFGTLVPIPAVDTLKNLAAGNYSAVISDSNNCTVTVYDTLLEPAVPSVTFAITNEICFGQKAGTAMATFVNATSGTVTYLWSDGQTNQTATGLAAGIDSVTCTDSNGCSVSGDTTISQPPSLPLNPAVTNSTCYGQPGSVTVTPTGGTNPYSYAWSAPIVGNTATVNVPAGNNYTVTATDVNQCQETTTFNVSQPPHIDITIAQTNILCFGNNTGDITLTPVGGTTGGAPPAYTYGWNPATASGSNPTGLIAGLYAVTVTDQANCSVDTTITITQPAAPLTVVVDSVNIACFGQSTGSITLLVTGGTAQYAYTWNPNVATDSIPQNLAAGNYAYTVQDANACQVLGSVNLTQPAQALTVVPGAPVNVLCFDSSTGMAGVAVSGGTPVYSYTWNPNVGNTDTVTNIKAGNYAVTVTDNNLCTATASFIITQPATGISATGTPVDEPCFGDAKGSVTIAASGGTGGPNYTYTWNPNVSTTNSATNLAANTYVVTVTDANACSISVSTVVTQPAQLAMTTTPTNVSCNGLADGAILAVVNANTGTPNYTYFADINGSQINSNGGQFPSLKAGVYIVVVTDAHGCADTVPTTVTQPDSLTDKLTLNNPTCYGYSNGSVQVVPNGGTQPYGYVFSNGVSNSSGFIFGLAQGTYAVTITDQHLCNTSDSGQLVQPDSVMVDISPAAGTVNLGDTLQLTTTTNQSGNVNYAWDPPSGLSCYDCPNPIFNGVYSQTYHVTITNQDSCTANAKFVVTVVPNYNIYIPNAFTPNGDGLDDLWQMYGNMSSLKQVQLMVFNRWGEKVFESDEMNFKWDGTFKGAQAPQGVYVYAIKFVWLDNHSDDTRKGTITLLR